MSDRLPTDQTDHALEQLRLILADLPPCITRDMRQMFAAEALEFVRQIESELYPPSRRWGHGARIRWWICKHCAFAVFDTPDSSKAEGTFQCRHADPRVRARAQELILHRCSFFVQHTERATWDPETVRDQQDMEAER